MSHKPRKRFGQHFLHDQHIIRRIIAAIAPDEPTPIVEIGPGLGALTLPLLHATHSLDVIEIDRDLARRLADDCSETDTLQIHIIDVLKFDFCGLGKGKFKIVGNLPYNISTPLLFHLLDQIHCIEAMIFMMQKEVVDRICAQPDCRDYGRLSVMVQSRCAVRKLFDVAPGAFTPPPQVAGSIVRLTPKPDTSPDIHDREIFSTVVKQAFSQRRKTIRNSLKNILPEEVFSELGIDPSVRAENLTVDDFIRLANFLHDIHKPQ